MTTAEYLNYLKTEERRHKLLAEVDTNPTKRKIAQKKAKRFSKLIAFVSNRIGHYETGDARKLKMDMETPESNMNDY